MQKYVKLKENRVADEIVNMSKRMQALKKAEKDLWYCASKLKSKKEKLQHTIQIYQDFYDKKLNKLLVQLKETE